MASKLALVNPRGGILLSEYILLLRTKWKEGAAGNPVNEAISASGPGLIS